MTFVDRLRKILKGEYHTHMTSLDSMFQLEHLLISHAAEIEALVRAHAGLVTMLLDTSVPIGPMRSRDDYPHELRESLKALTALNKE